MALVGQGRQDWQRTEQHDSLAILVEHGTGHVGTQRFGPFNVVGFTSLGGNVLLQSGGPVVFQATFAHDAAFTQLAGYRAWVQDSANASNAQLSLRCLGGYVRFDVTPLTGATPWQWTVDIAASNRPSESMFTPADPMLVNMQALAVGAGLQANIAATEIFAGAATVSINTGQAGVFWAIDAEAASGAWQTVIVPNVAGTSTGAFPVTLPPRPVRLRVGNGGAGAFSAGATLIANPTGAT